MGAAGVGEMTEPRNLAARARAALKELELGHEGAERMMGWRQHQAIAACSCTDARIHRVIVDLLAERREATELLEGLCERERERQRQDLVGEMTAGVQRVREILRDGEAQRAALPPMQLGRYDRSYTSPEDKQRQALLHAAMTGGPLITDGPTDGLLPQDKLREDED